MDKVSEFIDKVLNQREYIYCKWTDDYVFLDFFVIAYWFVDGTVEFEKTPKGWHKDDYKKKLYTKIRTTKCEKIRVQKRLQVREILMSKAIGDDIFAKMIVDEIDRNLNNCLKEIKIKFQDYVQ